MYVVTRVDRSAWPNGTGTIRLGMNQSVRQRYDNDTEFRRAYLTAVQNYERIRRKIDEQRAAGQPVSASDEQVEIDHRTEMESFTATQPLRKGDVVQVGPGIPHSLQHGVQVFEFQTPTYERNIISFNQQVLTQDHWDSSYAIANMSLDGPGEPVIDILSNRDGVCVERIVDFDEFSALRVAIAPNTSWALDQAENYAMLAMIEGGVSLQTAAGDLPLQAQSRDSTTPTSRGAPKAEQATTAFLPAGAKDARLTTTARPAVVLLALPKAVTAGTIPVC